MRVAVAKVGAVAKLNTQLYIQERGDSNAYKQFWRLWYYHYTTLLLYIAVAKSYISLTHSLAFAYATLAIAQ